VAHAVYRLVSVPLSIVTTVAEAPGEDADLVSRLCAGEEAAFTQLVDSWAGSMLRLARSIVTTEASAAEVVQETWVAVVASVDGFEGRSSLRTWIYRILVNTAKRRAAQEQRSVPWASLQLGAEPTVDPDAFQGADEPYPGHWRSFPAPWPEQAVLGREVLDVIREAVERLPAQQRAVITLRDIEGCSGPETCELLDLSEGNQRVLLHRARAAVRREVADYMEQDGPR
jgi:RNA polymerase sigma-70 factor (ECF subfamily)